MAEDNRACVVGLGQTEFRRWGRFTDRSDLSLACEAILLAVADAGLDPAEIDGLGTFATMAGQQQHPGQVQQCLSLPELRWASLAWGAGGGSGCGAVAVAAAAVESGRAKHVVVYRSICQRPGERFGQYRPDRPDVNFNAPFGVFSPAPMVAFVMRRHMYEYGTLPEHLGRIAVACRANANRNPNAVMRDRLLSMEEYLSSRIIADPLRLFDCCLESDGACAIVVTSKERARDLRQRPVEILSAVQGAELNVGTVAMGGHNMPIETFASAHVQTLAQELFGQAGITPADIDVAQFYDAFTAMVLLALEGYGFCAPGAAGPFIAEGNIDWPDGLLPINTAGGNLSEAYIHGFNLVLEGVRQLRGDSTSQVDGARTCLVASAPLEAPSSAMILAV